MRKHSRGGFRGASGRARRAGAAHVSARGAGAQLTAVPYRGGAEALTDVAAGRIDCTFTDMANGLAQSQAGRVRALAHSAKDPTPLAPGLPAAATVVPGYDIKVWFGVSAPLATPAPPLARANQAANALFRQPGVVERLSRPGFVPFTRTPEQFGQYARDQLQAWGEHVRAAGAEPR